MTAAMVDRKKHSVTLGVVSIWTSCQFYFLIKPEWQKIRTTTGLELEIM